ncbi:hypothetical protein [Streptomyces sp. NPDC047108]|uniref:hypothetical protein n=1 Tax=Streptomyces sp. NPDC047108 TaxID=3155025 RepID=UPI0033DD0A30
MDFASVEADGTHVFPGGEDEWLTADGCAGISVTPDATTKARVCYEDGCAPWRKALGNDKSTMLDEDVKAKTKFYLEFTNSATGHLNGTSD